TGHDPYLSPHVDASLDADLNPNLVTEALADPDSSAKSESPATLSEPHPQPDSDLEPLPGQLERSDALAGDPVGRRRLESQLYRLELHAQRHSDAEVLRPADRIEPNHHLVGEGFVHGRDLDQRDHQGGAFGPYRQGRRVRRRQR